MTSPPGPGLRQWTVDAFTDRPFSGNQAAVVAPLDAWPSDDWMQALAAENNVAETAFLLRTERPGTYGLRWFTPAIEVPLCGHATLASAHVLWNELGETAGSLSFETLKAGHLTVDRAGQGYAMDFPAEDCRAIEAPPGLAQALGLSMDAIVQVWSGTYLAVLVNAAAQVHHCQPNQSAIMGFASYTGRNTANVGVMATDGLDHGVDVVSRFFAPGSGIPEDPVTGSWHCHVAPLASARLGKSDLRCFQASPGRGGTITTSMRGNRVILAGQAVTTIESELRLTPG